MDDMKAELKSPHSIIDKYTALLDISCRLNSEKNFEQLLKLIADEATKHVDAERATIFILDKEKKELWAKVALGVSDTIRFDARLGLAGAGIPQPRFWGTVAAAASTLPAIGAGFVWIPAAIYLMATGQVTMGIALAIWGVAVISTVDNLLRIYVVGRGAHLAAGPNDHLFPLVRRERSHRRRT